MKIEIPDIEDQIAKGRLLVVKDWLNKNIHCLGRLYSAEDLVKKVTGEALNPHLYMTYLKEKYAAIYKITLG